MGRRSPTTTPRAAEEGPARHRRRSGQDRQWLDLKHFAIRRYGSRPNVVGVGIGTKFKRGADRAGTARRMEGITCVQFFVVKKRKGLKPGRRLPGFLHRRLRNGRADRRCRVPTDVIAVGMIRAAGCAAGSWLDSNADRGLVTLIFRNKAGAGHRIYLLTCAHVAGDLERSPPAYPGLTSGCSSADPFAVTVVNSTVRDGEVEFDIALAEVQPAARPVAELRVRDEDAQLDSFLPAGRIQQGLGASVVLRNASPRASVDSVNGSARIGYAGGTYLVHNLFGMNLAAGRGDSGGLVRLGTRAVGIVVAVSPLGWLWFQPLQPAVDFLNTFSPVAIRVFNPQPQNE